MKKIEIVIERCHAGFFAQACTDTYRCDVGYPMYATPWSAKRGVRRFMKALGATNWRFADEPEPEPQAVAEPAVKGVHPWARWEATDASGDVYEFSDDPHPYSGSYWWAHGLISHVRCDVRPVDFTKTLRRVNA